MKAIQTLLQIRRPDITWSSHSDINILQGYYDIIKSKYAPYCYSLQEEEVHVISIIIHRIFFPNKNCYIIYNCMIAV